MRCAQRPKRAAAGGWGHSALPRPLGAFYGLWPYKHFFRSQAARIFEGVHVPQAPRAGRKEPVRWTPGSHSGSLSLWPYKVFIGEAGKTAGSPSHPGQIPLRGVRSLTPLLTTAQKNVRSICNIKSSESLSKSIDSSLPIVRGVSLLISHNSARALSCSMVGRVGVWCRGMIGAF